MTERNGENLNPGESFTLVIAADGRVKFVWADELAGLVAEGEPDVRRASVVTWTPGGWVSELVNCGPRLGPFQLYEQALAAERALIEEKIL